MSLIGSLSSGVTGLQTFSKDLEVIGNNIANVNTTAFKSSTLAFSENFSNTLRSSQPATANTSNVLAAQIGTGVQFSGVNTNYNPGALSSTGQATDVGISGEGYFIVRDASLGADLTDSLAYATRVGNFRWDDKGFLVNQQGMRVQDVTGVDIKQTPPPAGASLQSVSINRAGKVVEFFTDGTDNSADPLAQQIGLMTFPQQGALMNKGNGLFDGFAAAGVTTPHLILTLVKNAPGTNALGTLESGTLEQSNVDLTSEFANMITAQRSFQANARVVTVSDSVLDDVVNLKRS
jgi:flagellar hook protein FlgE